MQRVTETTTLNLSISQQFAFNNLDSSEDFSLGGADGVRAYPSSEASGDEGTLLNVELSQKLFEGVNVFCFYDYGHIIVNKNEWTSSSTPNSYDLNGAGGGVMWSKSGSFMVKLTGAAKIGNNPAKTVAGADSDGTANDTRLWLHAGMYY
jgi:hemolysin activation/secretion protein